MAKTRVPSLPNPNAISDPTLRQLVTAMKEVIEVGLGQRGDELDRAATLRDLTEAGVISARTTPTGKITELLGTVQVDVVDLTAPPAAVNLQATGGFSQVALSWEIPAFYGNYGYTEIHRNAVDNLSTAVLVGVTAAGVFSDAVDTASTFYYWVRIVSATGVVGDFNAASGTVATTAIQPQDLLDSLAGQLSESELNATLNSRIDLVDAPTTGLVDVVTATTTGLVDRASALETSVNTTTTGLLDRATALENTVGDANSGLVYDLATLDSTVTDPTTGLTTKVSTLETTVGDGASGLVFDLATLDATVTNPTTGLTTKVSTLESTVGDGASGLVADVTSLSSTVNNETTGVAANASAVSSLSTSVSTNTSDLTTAKAQYVLKTDVNGKLAGFGLLNDGTSSAVEFLTDKFTIAHPSATAGAANRIAFAVEGGKTVMDGAYIKDATITDAKIGSVSADKISVATLSAFSADMGSITAGDLTSPDGKVNINLTAGTFDIKSSTTGARLEIKDNVIKVYDASGVLRVKMGDLTA